MQHTHSSQTAKQPTTKCLLCLHAPLSSPMPHCPLPCHDQLRRGGEGGIVRFILIAHCFIPPSPPLLSWSWEWERQWGMGQRQEGMSRHCVVVVGCLAAWLLGCFCLLMSFAILFKWCVMRAKANVVKPERAYLYPLGRESYKIDVSSCSQESSRSRRCGVKVVYILYLQIHKEELDK